jgi:hypothetical protein
MLDAGPDNVRSVALSREAIITLIERITYQPQGEQLLRPRGPPSIGACLTSAREKRTHASTLLDAAARSSQTGESRLVLVTTERSRSRIHVGR